MLNYKRIRRRRCRSRSCQTSNRQTFPPRIGAPATNTLMLWPQSVRSTYFCTCNECISILHYIILPPLFTRNDNMPFVPAMWRVLWSSYVRPTFSRLLAHERDRVSRTRCRPTRRRPWACTLHIDAKKNTNTQSWVFRCIYTMHTHRQKQAGIFSDCCGRCS